MDTKNAKQAIATLLSEWNELNTLLGSLPGAQPGATRPNVADPFVPFIGKAIGIRTVTFSQVGRLVEVHPTELVLEDAACIMDWGRFSGGASGTVSEVEPFPKGRVVVGRGAIVDCFEFGGKLPLSQK